MSDLPIDAIPEAGPQRDKGQYTMDFDNLDAEMAKIPLFMTDLPDEENDTLTALQSLVFDGTPEGIQEGKKNRYFSMIKTLTCVCVCVDMDRGGAKFQGTRQ